MALGDKINAIEALNPKEIVALKGRNGIFWVGQARYVIGAVTYEAWNGTGIAVMINGKEVFA